LRPRALRSACEETVGEERAVKREVGIETKEQLAIVTELGCHGAQGFLFSRPVLAHEFARLLEADRPMVGRAV
jgi:predicted signal transduction protein with EAL and GGDEF domain